MFRARVSSGLNIPKILPETDVVVAVCRCGIDFRVARHIVRVLAQNVFCMRPHNVTTAARSHRNRNKICSASDVSCQIRRNKLQVNALRAGIRKALNGVANPFGFDRLFADRTKTPCAGADLRHQPGMRKHRYPAVCQFLNNLGV